MNVECHAPQIHNVKLIIELPSTYTHVQYLLVMQAKVL